MNLLENYIQPGWTMRSLTKTEKEDFGNFQNEDWVRVDCKVNCYGRISKGRDTWVRSNWLAAVKQGYYMA